MAGDEGGIDNHRGGRKPADFAQGFLQVGRCADRLAGGDVLVAAALERKDLRGGFHAGKEVSLAAAALECGGEDHAAAHRLVAGDGVGIDSEENGGTAHAWFPEFVDPVN